MNNTVARPKSNFEVDLDNYESQIAAVLPQHVSLEKFKRVVMTAVARNPELYLDADRRTLFNSCIQCAADGLLPDGNKAALVIFKTKDKRTDQWVKAVKYMPMIAGIREKMRNTNEVDSAEAHCVYQNDQFDYALGDQSYITHKPTMADRGAFVGAYAIIKLKNGEVIREVMNREEIEKVRAVSKSTSGPWSEWYGEMARKSVLRRAAKAAPSSPELERLWSQADVDEPEQQPRIDPPLRPTREQMAAQSRQLPEPEPEPVDPASAGHADLDQEYRAVLGHDRETGEVTLTIDHGFPSGIVEPPPPPYDGAAVRKALWEGALQEHKAPSLDDYWQIQKPIWLELREKAPKEYDGLYADVTKRLQQLRKGVG